MDLAPFTRAGLRQREVGALVGVTQTTVGLWMRGERSPHFLLASRVKPVLAAVAEAVEAGELPLPATVPRGSRLGQIKKVVAARLRAQKR